MVEHVGLRSLVDEPLRACREAVDFQGDTCRRGLQLAYHVCHVQVDIRVGGKPRFHVFAEGAEVCQAASVQRVVSGFPNLRPRGNARSRCRCLPSV